MRLGKEQAVGYVEDTEVDAPQEPESVIEPSPRSHPAPAPAAEPAVQVDWVRVN